MPFSGWRDCGTKDHSESTTKDEKNPFIRCIWKYPPTRQSHSLWGTIFRRWRMKNETWGSSFLAALDQNLPETDLVGGLLSLRIETVKFVTGDLYNENEFYWLINGARAWRKGLISIRRDSIGEGCKAHGNSLMGICGIHCRIRAWTMPRLLRGCRWTLAPNWIAKYTQVFWPVCHSSIAGNQASFIAFHWRK